MILAVLEARCGMHFSGSDVYLNIAGGIRIAEPAADMAVAAALVSALANVPLPAETVFFGEIGLSGETRSVSQAALRLKEAARLGFEKAVIAKRPKAVKGDPLDVLEISHVKEIVKSVG
jgi:DNA repair protein RadA/Sms